VELQPEPDADVPQQNAPEPLADDVARNIDDTVAGEDDAVLVNIEQQPAGIEGAAEVHEAGPANPHQPRPRNENREVGAKKAKAIARRNQQRAYNEFMREQGDAQRAEWARDEAERQKQVAADQERRRAVDDQVREKERKEREARKAHAEAERQAELEAIKTAARMIEERLAENNFISIAEVKKAVKRDDAWIQELAKREGILGSKSKDGQKSVVLLTKSGWLVRVSAAMMNNVYTEAEAACARGDGKVTWHAIGRLVQNMVVSSG
jgi:vacuolar-type H+-ATPase subunit I/STV1